jgi:hypothetical protein
MKSVTRWFVLPRFSSCKPSPRWGGHKDRVSFNPFLLSNGHLDRVSFSSQSIGTLSPHKDHHTIGVSCLDYKCLGNKKEGRRKAIQAQELKWTQISLSLVTIDWNDLWTWERIWSLVCVLEWSLELFYWMQWLKTWMPWSVVVGGIYSPNHQSGRWGTLLSTGAPDTVRCASHVTQPLGFYRWSSDLWGHRTVWWCTRQVLFTVRCAFWRLLWLCACNSHCSLFTFAVDRWRASRCLRWHIGQSGATPDSPVNYSGEHFPETRSWACWGLVLKCFGLRTRQHRKC